jgi:hypothetical protein
VFIEPTGNVVGEADIVLTGEISQDVNPIAQAQAERERKKLVAGVGFEPTTFRL